VRFCLETIENVYFNAFILFIIIANTVVLSLDKYPGYGETGTFIIEKVSTMFTVIFTIEIIIKMTGLGVKMFFKDGFNIFDLIIVLTGLYGNALEYMGGGENNKQLMVLRAFRCFRIFKLFKVGDMRVLIDSQIKTIPTYIPFLFLFILFFYIFALIGMNFFAGKIMIDDSGNYDPVNGSLVREGYDTLGMSFLTIFQVLMGAEWRFIWYQNMLACGPGAAFFYVFV
jgi:voltage-dependent calcium channel L type alpha-1D